MRDGSSPSTNKRLSIIITSKAPTAITFIITDIELDIILK